MIDAASDTIPVMGRRKKFPEKCVAAFVPGTFQKIDEVLEPDEYRTDFVREAVKREVERRRKLLPKGE